MRSFLILLSLSSLGSLCAAQGPQRPGEAGTAGTGQDAEPAPPPPDGGTGDGGDGGEQQEPLPDFFPDADHLTATLSIDYVDAAIDPCLANEKCLSGNGTRTLLRFGSMIHNIGTADAYLGQPPNGPNDPNIPEYWHWDTCHEHWHFTAYANYMLLSEDRSETILTGHKNGFCLEDVGCTTQGLQPVYNCQDQGITAGCYDLYDETLPCQWIDITDLADKPGYTPSTAYTLQVVVNQEGYFPELNLRNNAAFATVVIEDVPPYNGPPLDQVIVPNGPGRK
ncbi:Lysyl oxidase-domain-containing protein [Phlyctochytrium arcticum]|nr:Lysyl oxidase-domain-containing protein [Phlyctochytrium arcticum]